MHLLVLPEQSVEQRLLTPRESLFEFAEVRVGDLLRLLAAVFFDDVVVVSLVGFFEVLGPESAEET